MCMGSLTALLISWTFDVIQNRFYGQIVTYNYFENLNLSQLNKNVFIVDKLLSQYSY